jgi:hypothetical protein
MKKTIFLLLSAFCLQQQSMAQEQAALQSLEAKTAATNNQATEFAKTITAQDLKKHLSILASDEYEGRETGEKGQKMAADYIMKYFKGLDLQAPVKSNDKNPYFQTFPLSKKTWGEGYLQQGKQKFELFKDFFAIGDYTQQGEVEFIFAGYGIVTDTYSDYENLDVKGKVVVVMTDEPKDKEGNYLFSKTKNLSTFAKPANKGKIAKEKGALGVLFVFEDEKKFTSTLNLYRSYFASPAMGFQDEQQQQFASLYTSPDVAASLLATKTKKINEAIAKIVETGKPYSKTISKKVQINLTRNVQEVMTENVLGFMEGTDKKDEVVVISAHYDHIGIVNGKINNGADDDGSGTVSVLELAEAFNIAKQKGFAPRRSILFMLFTGEEKGLLGSEYYSKNPIFPLKNTVVDLNIDMVGRVDAKHQDNPNYIYLIGSDKLSTELHKLSEEAKEKYTPELELDYTYNDENDPNRFYYRSDHYNFAVHNIPIIFYFNGTHPDYHAPTDDVEKINFEKMEKINHLIFYTAWELANRENRIKVDKAE